MVLLYGYGNVLSGFEKICRFHKNQAVNLLQIPIHAQDVIVIDSRDAVKFNGSRVPGGFGAKARFCQKTAFIKDFAAKFLH